MGKSSSCIDIGVVRYPEWNLQSDRAAYSLADQRPARLYIPLQ